LAPVRVRQHVNPLSQKFQVPISVPHWSKIYQDSARPLHLDIGSARGRFLLTMAQERPDWNFLGLEIRRPLVKEANQDRDRSQLSNLHYLFGNANFNLGQLLATLPPGTLHYVSIQFPDPWFKQRHRKRRVVQPSLLNDLAAYLIPGGTVLLQSDVEAVAIAMVDHFQTHPAFERPVAGWLPENPLPVPTERECLTQEKGLPVYRAIFRRTSAKAWALSNKPQKISTQK
jgi:tRNA (guanine-N7-)-methyltransferase